MGRVLRQAIVLVLLSLAACRADSHRYATAEETRDFVEALRRARCVGYQRCFPDLAAFSLENCLALARDGNQPLVPGTDEALFAELASGSARVWADRTAACVEALNESGCDLALRGFFETPACWTAIDGGGHTGDACLHPLSCAAQLVCDWGSDDSCPGHCIERNLDQCRNDAECPEGTHCLRTIAAPLDPPHFVCQRPLAAGAACLWDEACASGLCTGNGLTPGVCTDTVPGLEPCHETCGLGDVCEGGRCVPTEGRPCGTVCAKGLVCQPKPMPLHCERQRGMRESCRAAPCAPGLTCNFNWTCTGPLGPCSLQSDCPAGYECRLATCMPRERRCDAFGCDDGMVCDAAQMACVAAPGEGDPCGARCPTCPATTCRAGLICEEGTCRATTYRDCHRNPCAEGESCVRNPFDGSHSISGSECIVAPGLGEPCGPLSDSDFRPTCREGECRPDAAGNPVCQAPVPRESLPCGDEGPCAEGFSCYAAPPMEARCEPPAAEPTCVDCSWDRYDLTLKKHPYPAHGAACTIFAGAAEPCADPEDMCIPLTAGGAKCLKAKGLGDSCSEPFECGGVLSPNLCDPATKRCVAGRRDGDSCFVLREYATCDAFSAWCDAKAEPPACRAFKAAGEKCVHHLECGYRVGKGFCGDGTCATWTNVCAP